MQIIRQIMAFAGRGRGFGFRVRTGYMPDILNRGDLRRRNLDRGSFVHCAPGEGNTLQGRGSSRLSVAAGKVVDGGCRATALGYGIHTQGETLEELRAMVKDAVKCSFDESMQAAKIIRLHFVREEILAA